VPASGDVISVAIDRALEKSEFHTAQCGDWPKSFIADDRGQYCCNQAGPLTSLDCSAGACKGHPYPLSCSDDLVLDADQLFATQDTRIVAVDRASGQVKQLFRRKRHTRELHASATHLYWFEGDAQADLYRAPKTGTAAAELLARRQLAAEFLTIGDSGACWVAAAPRTELDFESASQKSSHAEAGATVTKAHPLELPHRAIYCLKTP
jgi:hypothetical protein